MDQRPKTPSDARKNGSMDDTPHFGVELLRPSDGLAIVALEGEVDIYVAPKFKEALVQSMSEGVRRVIIDLTRATFIDSAALGVVVGGVKRMTAQGGTLDIVRGPANITRTFEITGLDRILRTYGSLEEALAAKR